MLGSSECASGLGTREPDRVLSVFILLPELTDQPIAPIRPGQTLALTLQQHAHAHAPAALLLLSFPFPRFTLLCQGLLSAEWTFWHLFCQGLTLQAACARSALLLPFCFPRFIWIHLLERHIGATLRLASVVEPPSGRCPSAGRLRSRRLVTFGGQRSRPLRWLWQICRTEQMQWC